MTEDRGVRAAPALQLAEPAPAGALPVLADRFDASHRVDFARFDEAARKRIAEIAARTPRLDGAAVNAFGIEPQQKANLHLDQLLDGLRTSDVGAAGDLVAQLSTGVKMLDVPGMKREAEGSPGFPANLPLIGKHYSAFRRFKARYEAINQHFARIEESGRRDMARIAAMDSKLDGLVATNLANMREIELHVAAGQVVLDREKARFAGERAVARVESDPVKLAAVRDLGDQINGFESRLLRLRMAAADALLSVPQTRLAQSAGRIEYRNVVDTLLFDLPRLKAAVLRVAALKRISDASKASDARRKLTQQMSQAGVEALDRAYVEAKKSEAGPLAEIAAMGEIADRILGIIGKGAEIDGRNRRSRAEAELALAATREKFIVSLGRSSAQAVEARA